MGSYVVMGAKLSCTMGAAPTPLTILPPRRVLMSGKPRANIGDCKPMVNVMPFGVCTTTTMPCVPGCSVWMNGKVDVLVDGLPALVDTAMAICPVGGGVIRITDSGQ